MVAGGGGPVYAFWARVERARVRRGLTKAALAAATAAHTDDGQPLARTTIDELRQVRRTTPRVVHALAAVLGIPLDEAERLAGLTPPPSDRADSIANSPTLKALETDPTLSPEHRALLRDTALALMRSASTEGQPPNLRVVLPEGDTEQAG